MSNRRPALSQAEIRRVFKELGLSTQKKRDQVLLRETPVPTLPAPPKEYLHEFRISNRSLSLDGEDAEHAKLG